MKTNEEMRKIVMRRVWGIYAIRWLARPFIRVSVLAIAAVAIVGSVSVASVAQNAASKGGVLDLLDFALVAFRDTDALVQLAVLVVGVILVASATDLARAFQKQPSLA